MFDLDFNSTIVDLENFNIADLGEALGFGGSMVLIGMASVFAVLIILWACLVLFKIFFHDIPEKKSKAAAAAPVVPVQEVVQTTTSDAEIVAMAESESIGTKFQVVSFKRK